MNPERKTLPIGIESFATIRRGNFYYVDKTPFALSLAQEAGRYFLSRPRRFGKSLFVDMLKELFEGNQALFVGLDIHDKWDWTQRFPVIHISFAAGELKSRAELDRRIRTILRLNLERLGLDVDPAEDIGDCFERLFHQAAARHGQRVVILVDEYDKPILDNLLDREAATEVFAGSPAAGTPDCSIPH
jgi:Predicted AAA-ATPase